MRYWIKLFFWLIPLGLMLTSPTWAQPNVVIILADDLGYGDLAVYGHPAFQSPHLDRMADEGVQFTNFYVPVPYCAPSRATLLTGRYPFRTGMVWNPAPDSGIDEVGIRAQETTLAELLKSQGYSTACIGKWHLGHLDQYHPLRHGFDEYLGILYSNDMRPVELWDGEEVIEYPVVQATLTRRYTERAIQFIEAHSSEPFFLYLAHAMPHKPLAASEEFYKLSAAGLYGDVIAELDWSVGQILTALEKQGLDQETLVMFSSDNGPWYGGSTGGLRGMKALGWEGGIRVPMLARWPGHIPFGLKTDAIAGIVDLFPTVAEITQTQLPRDLELDGRSIFSLMTEDGAVSPHEFLLFMRGPQLAAVRKGKWKLHVRSPGEIPRRGDNWVDPRGPDGVTLLAPFEQPQPSQYPGAVGGDRPEEMMLFNLELDPAERKNQSRLFPEIVEELKRIFEEYERQVPEFPRPQSIPLKKPGPRPDPALQESSALERR